MCVCVCVCVCERARVLLMKQNVIIGASMFKCAVLVCVILQNTLSMFSSLIVFKASKFKQPPFFKKKN